MAGENIAQILSAAIIILAIFGILYMIDFNNSGRMLMGITLLGLCGLLIFINAFIKKHLG